MTRNMDLLGIPSLPMRAFVDDGSGRIKPQGKGGSAPKTPDYTAAAEATAQGNLDLAKQTTQANRVNQYSPWGSTTYTNDRQFDQGAYDAAMEAYGRQSQPQNNYDPFMGYDPRNPYASSSQYMPSYMQQQQQQGPAPNRDDFWSGGDTWSQHTQLSPELQAQLDQQNAMQSGMFGPQNDALARVQQTMSQGFDTSGLPAQAQVTGQQLDPSQLTQFGQMGNTLDPSQLTQFGQMGQVFNPSQMTEWGQMGDVLNMNSLPGMGSALDQSQLSQGGSALNMGRLPGMGTAFNPTGEQLSVYDPNVQTNQATEQLMQRINPQLDRQQESLRAQLANQGITQGSPAYDAAMEQHRQSANDAYTQASLTGINLGMQQQGMQFGQGMQNRQLTAAEQAQQFNQQQGLRFGEAGLQNQQFGQSEAIRQREAAEQAQQYNQQQGLRMGEAGLQQQQFGQQTTNYGLTAQQRAQQAAEQAQQFGQQTTNYGLTAQQRAQQAAEQQQQYGQQTTNYGLTAQQRAQQAGEQQQQFGQAESLFGQQQSARNNALQEQSYLRGLPMQEMQQMMGGGQVQMPQFPGYTQQGQTAGADYMGAANQQYQGQLGAYNAQQAGQSNIMGGLFGMGGALMGTEAGAAGLMSLFSDRRLKRNIKAIGKADSGLTIYSYQYVTGGPTQLGYMADEVQKVAPDAVGERGGFLTVDYSKV